MHRFTSSGRFCIAEGFPVTSVQFRNSFASQPRVSAVPGAGPGEQPPQASAAAPVLLVNTACDSLRVYRVRTLPAPTGSTPTKFARPQQLLLTPERCFSLKHKPPHAIHSSFCPLITYRLGMHSA